MVIAAIKPDKRKNIITAAVRLWQQAHNWNKVSLADIAREAGISPTTIYNNFKTRQGLVEEVIKQLTEEILAKQRAILKSNLPFPAKVQSMLSVKMKAIKGMQADLLDKICTDPVAKKYIDRITEIEAKPMIMEIIEEGKREGFIRPDLPDEVIVLYFDIIQAGRLTCSEAVKRVISNRRLANALMRLVYFGPFQKEFDLTLNNSSMLEKRQ